MKGLSTHPLLAHRAALALCRRARFVGDWRAAQRVRRTQFNRSWDADDPSQGEIILEWLEDDCRLPPLPTWEDRSGAFAKGARFCRLCGQRVYAGRSWLKSAGKPHHAAGWHSVCLVAHHFWTKPFDFRMWLADRQRGKCAYSGANLFELVDRGWGHGVRSYMRDDLEADHLKPLWSVEPWRSWPRVLEFWGPDNVRLITKEAHRDKTRREAGQRALARRGTGIEIIMSAST